MIKKFIDRFQSIKATLLKEFSKKEPEDYSDLFVQTIKIMYDKQDAQHDIPDYERITIIDHGDYQGTLLFIVGEVGYQPSKYWATTVSYGSCSGCDTFEEYREYDNPEESAPHMVTMAMHMIQELKEIS